MPVPVRVVGGGHEAVGRLLVVHEGDPLVGLRPERRARQAQPPPRDDEGLADRLAPGQSVTRVVDLVEDDERARVLGARPVQHRVRGHRRVRRDVPGQARRAPDRRCSSASGRGRGRRPMPRPPTACAGGPSGATTMTRLMTFRRHEPRRERQRERGLAGAGRRADAGSPRAAWPRTSRAPRAASVAGLRAASWTPNLDGGGLRVLESPRLPAHRSAPRQGRPARRAS